MSRRLELSNAALLLALGTTLVLAGVVDAWTHVVAEGDALELVAVESLPTFFAQVAVLAVGVLVAADRLSEEFRRRAGVWAVGGAVLVGWFVGVVLVIHLAGLPRQAPFVIVDIVTVGAVGGLAAAHFAAGEKRRSREYEREWRRLRALFENSTDAIAMVAFEDEGPCIRDVNPAFERCFGVEAAAVRGQHIDAVVAPEDSPAARELSERAAGGERFETTVTRKTSDGRPRSFRLQAIPVRSESNPPEGFAVYTDRTEEERHLGQLSRLHEYTRKLMTVTETSDVADVAVTAASELLGYEIVTVFLHDPQAESLRPASSSPAVSDILGRGPRVLPIEGSIAGRVFREGERVVCGDVREDSDVANRETVIRSEVIFPLGEYGVLIVGSRERDAFTERDVAVVDIIADNVEAALVRAERESTVRSQKKRLDEFASVVSHDLRNPLHTAEGYLELARETGEADHFDRAENALTRMTRLIDDLLSLARGERTLSVGTVDLGAAVRDAWNNADTGDMRLETAAPEGLGTLQADRNRLEELLGNLFRNAAEHSSASPRSHDSADGVDDEPVESANDPGVDTAGDASGSATGTVRVGRLDDGGFYVADDGPGIAADVRETLFDPGVTTAADGTGFGLAIVRQIAADHGWTVEATESESGGARFDIRVDDDVEATDAAAAERTPDATGSRARPTRPTPEDAGDP